MNGFIKHSRSGNQRIAQRFGSALFSCLIFASAFSNLAATREPAPPSIKPIKLLVQPAEINLQGPDDFHGILVTAITADGSTYDVTSRAQFICKQTKLAEVS